jgi:hypothetical protein
MQSTARSRWIVAFECQARIALAEPGGCLAAADARSDIPIIITCNDVAATSAALRS